MQSVLRFGVSRAARSYGVSRLYRDIERLNRKHNDEDRQLCTRELLKFYLRVGVDHRVILEDRYIGDLLERAYLDIAVHPRLEKMMSLVE